MQNDLDLLSVIVDYCDTISDAVERFGDDQEEFLSNKHYSQSCAFSLIQIGEAVKRLSSDTKAKSDAVPWSQIAKFRDMIAHQYGRLDLNLVWISIVDEIPVLRRECIRLLTFFE